MNDEAEAAERALALQSTGIAVGDAGFFVDETERELSRMEDKRLIRRDLDRRHESFGGCLRIDDEIVRRVEDEEMLVEVDIHARRLNIFAIERLDGDITVSLGLYDIAIG